MGTSDPLSLQGQLALGSVSSPVGTIGLGELEKVDAKAGGQSVWWERVDEYVDHKVLMAEWTAASAKVCGQILRQFVRSVDVAGFDVDALAGFVNSPDIAVSTRGTRWTVVRGFLAWAGVDVVVGAPPLPRRVPRPLADVDVAALLAVCDDRDEAFVSLAVCEGLRSAELRRVEVADLDLDGSVVFVQGKGGHQRWVPLTDATAARIRRYCDTERGWSAGPLIVSRNSGDGVAYGWFGARSAALMERAGIKRRGVSLHSLRHTAATRLWMETSDLFMTQQLLGHSNVATTARYVASRPTAQMRAAMNRVAT